MGFLLFLNYLSRIQINSVYSHDICEFLRYSFCNPFESVVIDHLTGNLFLYVTIAIFQNLELQMSQKSYFKKSSLISHSGHHSVWRCHLFSGRLRKGYFFKVIWEIKARGGHALILNPYSKFFFRSLIVV